MIIQLPMWYILFSVPAPLVTILGESSTPYNGTNFTLTSMIEVDENVDTAVVLSAVWSGNGGSQETLSPPYLTSLVFEPLTPNGSNMYTLSVTIRPSGSSAFILSNTGTATHNLIVQCKFCIIFFSCRLPAKNDYC